MGDIRKTISQALPIATMIKAEIVRSRRSVSEVIIRRIPILEAIHENLIDNIALPKRPRFRMRYGFGGTRYTNAATQSQKRTDGRKRSLHWTLTLQHVILPTSLLISRLNVY